MTEDDERRMAEAIAVGTVIARLGFIIETDKLGDARGHALVALDALRKAGFDVDGIIGLAKVKT